MESLFEIKRNVNITDDFVIGEEMETRGLYTQRRAVHRISGIERHVKIVNKRQIHKYNEFVEQLDRLRILDHPNLCKIFEIYEDKLNFYFVVEAIKGGDLFDAIIQKDSFNEKDAANIIR
jgi:calcium-dependent protein kinase